MSALLHHPDVASHVEIVGRSAVVNAVRQAIAAVREGRESPPSDAGWLDLVAREIERGRASSLRPVLNATGVVLHTNLGRAPLAPDAVSALQLAAAGYSTLEFDPVTGGRGSRDTHCVSLLTELTGAEDAIVVNNCAAALVLALSTLAAGRTAIISRGELIEIGGSFRIPDIMSRSAAALVEVGTTNRTHLLDYRAAVNEQTGAIVRIHRSNFAITGFTAQPSLTELAQLSAELLLPLVFDLGSGLLVDLQSYGFPAEPTARHAIADGASVVLMSGDKLLGGPQAGIVVGRRDIVQQMRANPLARALRTDKLTLAALEATLRLYRDPEFAVRRVPVLAMLTVGAEEVARRCRNVVNALSDLGHTAAVVRTTAVVGAGAFPAHTIPSAAVALGGDAERLSRRLRQGAPGVVGRIEDGRLLLDLRSVPEREDPSLLAVLSSALAA